MREIGSEFWIESIPMETTNEAVDTNISSWLSIGGDYCLLYSGRTAIDYVLSDIPKTIRSVYMPSYCCYSMLQPFLDRGIKVYFYGIELTDNGISYRIDYEKPCDIFFAISYFGYLSTTIDAEIEVFRNKGITIIEDITHRLLSKQMYCDKSDYSIASLRKWFPIPSGGLAVKRSGKFSKRSLKAPPPLINTKISAMQITENKGDKQAFLTMFSRFNKGLQYEYRNIEIDSLSRRLLAKADFFSIKQKRRENTKYLCEALKKNQRFVKPMISTFSSDDCLLFFPVRINTKEREALRNYLIVHDIYCPIHWPITNEAYLNVKTRQVYEEELSLIIDQRYGIDDMQRIVETIGDFYSTK